MNYSTQNLRRRNLNVPAEDIFIHQFQFNLTPPALPIPYQKTLYYPLNPDRYTKPKLTTFDIKENAKLLARCDLGIPVSQLIMNQHLFNQNQNLSQPIDTEIESILNQTYGQTSEEKTIQQGEQKIQSSALEQFKAQAQYLGATGKANIKQSKIENYKQSLESSIEKTFQDIQNINFSKMVHPNKPGIYAKKIYDVFPNKQTENINLSLIQEKESSDITLKKEVLDICKPYILKSVLDLDNQQIFKSYHLEADNSFEDNTTYDYYHKKNFAFTNQQVSKIQESEEMIISIDNQKAYLHKLKGSFLIRQKRQVILQKKTIKDDEKLENNLIQIKIGEEENYENVRKKVKKNSYDELPKQKISFDSYNNDDQNDDEEALYDEKTFQSFSKPKEIKRRDEKTENGNNFEQEQNHEKSDIQENQNQENIKDSPKQYEETSDSLSQLLDD